MFITEIKKATLMGALFGILGVAHATVTFGLASNTDDAARRPELPAGCEFLAVDEGYVVIAHAYAVGVQIYRWNGTSWAFYGPEANLYASKNYRGHIGSHYVGPVWESNSGSLVSGTGAVPCAVDAKSVPWLKLSVSSSTGPGIFEGVTFIQRINTQGGVRPDAPGTTVGEEARVPYTAEYYFYKAQE